MTTFYRFDIMKNLRIFQFGIVVLLCGILSLPLSAQTEVMAWSNITGVRVDGELIDFESSLRVGTLKGVWRMVQNRAGRWDSPLQGT